MERVYLFVENKSNREMNLEWIYQIHSKSLFFIQLDRLPFIQDINEPVPRGSRYGSYQSISQFQMFFYINFIASTHST